MKAKIRHLALINDWERFEVKSPKTLVLGSFNPYIPNQVKTSITDFYYGRIASGGPGNYFWKTIGKLKHNDEHFFDRNLQRKIDEMNESNFIFRDLIDEIIIDSDSEDSLNQFVNDKIFKNFADDNIWVTKTGNIRISRLYNERVFDLIKDSNSIKKVINTLGSSRGNFNFNKREAAWQGYVNKLNEVCNSQKSEKIILSKDSFSPSPQGVGSKIVEFEKWILNNILD